MLRILAKSIKSPSMAIRSESQIEAHDVLEDLSSWEIVNPSDDELEDTYSLSDAEIESKHEDSGSFGSPCSDISMKSVRITDPLLVDALKVVYRDDRDEIIESKLEDDLGSFGSRLLAVNAFKVDYRDDGDDVNDDRVEIESQHEDLASFGSTSVHITAPLLAVNAVEVDYHDDYEEEEEEKVEEEDEDDDDRDDDDYDDELVPRWLADKFGRQRIRKLGKRACSRMNNSKRGPYYYNRPGCVRGKHGLGVQHSYI